MRNPRAIGAAVGLAAWSVSLGASGEPVMSTVAGGGPNNLPALAANLDTPMSIAVDLNGDLFIAAYGRGRVFKVDGSGELTHIAGGGWSEIGDGGPATEAILRGPLGLALGSDGGLYIAEADNHRIRRVDFASGVITTIAGDGLPGFSGDGGPAVNASLLFPRGIAFDPDGNLFISDAGNQRIRRIDAATGIITTVAGGGSGGDSGPATSALLSSPYGIAVDAADNFYFADAFRVRRVDADSGIITTVAGGGNSPGDGVPATSVRLFRPAGVALDAAGNLLIADARPIDPQIGRIHRVDSATGIITSIAGGNISGSIGDGGAATNASLLRPFSIALDGAGNLFITDTGRDTVRRVDAATGIITRVAGNGTPGFTSDGVLATSADLGPSSIAIDRHGNLLVADSANARVRHVDAATGIVTTVAGNGVFGPSGDGGPATNAGLAGPIAIALDHADNLFILTWHGDDRIRRVDATTGIITTVAILGWNCFTRGITVDAAGNVFVACSIAPGHPRPAPVGRVLRVDALTTAVTTFAGGGAAGVLGDGGPATNVDLSAPSDVLVDADGNLLIADFGNRRVRHVDVITGVITTVAGGGLPGFSGDGGPATSASLEVGVSGLALDSAGNLFIASGHRIRRVDAVTQIITTVAGDGCTRADVLVGCFGGDGGPATGASLNFPSNVETDSDGSLYIADEGNRRVRKVAEPTLAVAVDIKPGSTPNSINPMEQGVIPVAILGAETFDVSEIDGGSLAFAAGEAAPAHDVADPTVFADHLEDVNGDGITDLVSHYRTEEAGIAYGDMTACLSGSTLDGVPFNGCDAVRTVPDMDGDRLLDLDEQSAGTNAFYRDTDNDGYDDGAEVLTLRTDPLDALDPAPAPVEQSKPSRLRNRRR